MRVKKKTLLIVVVIFIVLAIIILQQTKKVPTESLAQNATKSLAIEGTSARVIEKAKHYPQAIELVSPDSYLNTNNEPITLQQFIGKKVILVDFWTYSCINCQRTLPYVESWWEKYNDKGLVIVGVHTPEFDFEKERGNVEKSLDKYGINYPVVQDNNYLTWRAYNNHYWPHKYLIDIDGFIAYDHIGEGGYEETEKKIVELLDERNSVLGLNSSIASNISTESLPPYISSITPEIYFGYAYARGQLGNGEGWQANTEVSYSLPAQMENDKFYLQGKWKNAPDSMELVDDNGIIYLNYTAKNVYLVAGSSASTSVPLTITLDGKDSHSLNVINHDLYALVNSSTTSNHLLKIQASKGLQAYTFTFG